MRKKCCPVANVLVYDAVLLSATLVETETQFSGDSRLVAVCSTLVFPAIKPVALNSKFPAARAETVKVMALGLSTVMVIEFVVVSNEKSQAMAIKV